MSPYTTLRSALIWTGVVALVCLLWMARTALLLAFAAILLASLLRVFMRIIRRISPLNESAGIAVAVFILLGTVFGISWLFGWQVADQFNLVLERAKGGQATIINFMHAHSMGPFVDDLIRRTRELIHAGVSGFFSVAMNFLEGLIVFFISAIYLAARPEQYRAGIAMLSGPKSRKKMEDGLALVGTSLELWLVGQLIVMFVVGLLSFVAALLIGLPGALALGLIAAATEIVPYIGPFVGVIPALFVALTLGFDAALWTMAAYLGIHLIEGYVLGPMLQRYFLLIPPALILIGIFAAGLIFGPLGVVIGAPMTAAIFTAIKVFYVRRVLDEKVDVTAESPV